MKIQFTLFCTNGKYRPIATIIDVPTVEELENKEHFEYWKKRALNRIAAARYKTGADLMKSGYTLMKWRIADSENRKQYEQNKIKDEILKHFSKK